MANESGRKIAVGIGRETTPGTTVAPAYFLKHSSLDFFQRQDKEMNDGSLNVLDKYSSAETMKDYAEGKIAGRVGDRSFGLILAAAFGALDTTTTNADASGNVKDHTYAQSQSNEPLSLTIAIKDLNRDERYALSRLKKLTISCEAGGFLMYETEWLGKKPTTSAGNTVAYVAENEFKAKHLVAKLASSLAGLTAASAITIKSFKIDFDFNVDAYYALGSNDPNNIFRSEVEISGEFVFLFDTLTHQTSSFTNLSQALRLDAVNTDVTIGTAANPRLKLDFAKVNFIDWGVDQGLGNMVEQTVGIQGLYSLSDAQSWAALLTNLVTSY